MRVALAVPMIICGHVPDDDATARSSSDQWLPFSSRMSDECLDHDYEYRVSPTLMLTHSQIG
jgi:hypothetical protein